jgi:hypothetical protein
MKLLFDNGISLHFTGAILGVTLAVPVPVRVQAASPNGLLSGYAAKTGAPRHSSMRFSYCYAVSRIDGLSGLAD